MLVVRLQPVSHSILANADHFVLESDWQQLHPLKHHLRLPIGSVDGDVDILLRSIPVIDLTVALSSPKRK